MDVSDDNLRIKRVGADHRRNAVWPPEKKIEVVTKWLALGNMRLVSELTGVSYAICRNWRTEPWWKDLEAEVRASRRIEQDSKLSKIVNKSLDAIDDRLTHGDYFFNQKTGGIERRPVTLRDATGAANSLMQRQAILEKQNVGAVHGDATKSIEDQLKLLAGEFAKFNNRNKASAVDIPFTEIAEEESPTEEDNIE